MTRSRVQAALEHLRTREPAFAWKSARGTYAIDDVSMQHWHAKLVEGGLWLPATTSAHGAQPGVAADGL